MWIKHWHPSSCLGCLRFRVFHNFWHTTLQNDRDMLTAQISFVRIDSRHSWGIPAAFVARFMVLRNCSPRSMGRTRPTWHQVAHLSWRFLNPVGPIISSVICHDYLEIIGLADNFSATVYKRDCCSSLLGRIVIMRWIKGMSYRDRLSSREEPETRFSL